MKIEYYVVIEDMFSMEPIVITVGPFKTEIDAWIWVRHQDISPNHNYVSVMPILILGG